MRKDLSYNVTTNQNWKLVSGIGMIVIVAGVLGVNWLRRISRKTVS